MYWISASTEDIAIKTTTSRRIQSTCFLSLIFWKKISFKKSMVRVELEAITREDKVDMEADSTRITTREISRGESPESMAGMMESYPWAATSTWSENSLPKPPRK